MELAGRNVIVTGGARGIGAATVRALTGAGARVAVLDVLDDLGVDVARRATEDGPGEACFHHCDVADREQVDQRFAEAAEEVGGLHVLFDIAGVEHGGPAEEGRDEDWAHIWEVNVRGTMLTNIAAFRAMRATGGQIVNVGSDAGLDGYAGLAAYGASKGAVMAWTRNVAIEWAPFDVTVNAVVPAIWTPMYEEHRARMGPDELAAHDAAMGREILLGGRLGDAERDLGPVMVFLATPGARFVTGQLLAVNGGKGRVR